MLKKLGRESTWMKIDIDNQKAELDEYSFMCSPVYRAK